MRPERLVVVAGTGTEVGKTWVASRLAAAWRDEGRRVAARKPAQSFAPGDEPSTTDASVLGSATGEHPDTVCPPARSYAVAMAPPMAADALGRERIAVADLAAEVHSSWPDPAPEVGIVELAGGCWSPAAHDGDGLDLTAALAPDVVLLVADAGLGTLNAVRPAVAALRDIAPVVLLLNRFANDDDLHLRNRAWLSRHDGVDAFTEVGAPLLEALGPHTR